MSDLIKRLRYKYADILHLEAADRIEKLTADNRFLKEELDMAHNQAELRVEGDRLVRNMRDV